MAFLDMDEQLLDLLQQVEIVRSPLIDVKDFPPCDIALVEGGLCNADNVRVLREIRQHCTTLVAVGACAINGGVPAMRNHYSVQECLAEAYLHAEGLHNPQIPNDPELPLLLANVHPLHEVVRVDYYLAGCPPPAATFATILADLIAGREPHLVPALLRYD